MIAEHHQGACSPCPGPFNLAAHVMGCAEAQADKVALAILRLSGAERWSYARLKSAILGTGTGLLREGLRPGDRVLMRLGNTVEFPIAYLGAIAVGLVPIPTSAQLTAPEVTGIMGTTQPALILQEDGVACPETNIPVLHVPDLQKMHDLPAADWHMGDPERAAYIVYTSGTSGMPRAVCHAHRAIWARRMMVHGWYGLRPEDRLCHAGALNWTFTLGTGLMDPWTMGATALIPEADVTPAQIPLLLNRHDATIFAAAPGVYRKMLRHDTKLSLPRLRHGLAAGEKLSATLRQHWQEATDTPIFEAYGLSECSTFISGSPDHPSAPGTLGRPQDGRRVAIMGADGPVESCAEGTIAVHKSDPGLMLGYLGAPEATAAKFVGDWFLTGDQGIMDEHGEITYLGRDDDMMNAGGVRVSPIEVEEALLPHPGINEVAVTHIEVKEGARVIMAFYTGSETLDPAEFDAFARERLAAYKAPRDYIHVDALPTGANGKLLRRALRPIYEDRHGQA
jgi:acyl-coenzyme A synthetase/AMP-(fatty) acid ligase